MTANEVKDALAKFVKYGIYNRFIRARTPRKLAYCNGFVVRGAHLFDLTDYKPWSKEGLVRSVRSVVREGDRVVEVGTGPGLAALHAAERGGTVETFDGSRTMVNYAREAVLYNGPLDGGYSDSVTVHHAVVGDVQGVYGPGEGATFITPPEILEVTGFNECDVLVMDCEGSEIGILREMELEPRSVVVESHPSMGAPPEAVISLLRERGFETRTELPTSEFAGEKRIVTGARSAGDDSNPPPDRLDEEGDGFNP